MFGMPITASGLTVFSQTVPFIPIVLGGHAEMYAPSANFYASYEDYLLRVAEYGMRPSYFLTGANPIELIDTNFIIHSSQWAVWKPQIEADTAFLRSANEATKNAGLTAHRNLAQGIYESTFGNGTVLLINYTHSAFTTADWHTIPPRNYIVR
jgi:hypothetical protein